MNRKLIYLLGLGIISLQLYNSQMKNNDNIIEEPDTFINNEYLDIEQRIKELSYKTMQLQNKVNKQIQSLNT